jgi:Spy/CpxP family protein refolding chaperone
MSTALKWKLIAGFLLVFIAGGVTGGFLAAAQARRFMFGPGHHGLVAERMRERLRSELNLTPEQLAKISPVIDRTGAQLEQIRMETTRRVHETFAQAHREMAPSLTDEQRTKLEQLRQRHRHFTRRFHHRGDRPAPEATPP